MTALVNFHISILVERVDLHRLNGTITSPYYPNSYHFEEFEDFTYIYHVEIPFGHVILNFTEINLAGRIFDYGNIISDYISVYDGNETSAAKLRTFSPSQTDKRPAVFVSSSNQITVKFRAKSLHINQEKIYRFKAFYTTAKSGKFDCTNDSMHNLEILMYVQVLHLYIYCSNIFSAFSPLCN